VSAKIILILGGARSGKSAHALQLARRHSGAVLYTATAEAGDEEMAARIARHRAERPAHWHMLEAPRRVGQALRAWQGGPLAAVVVDCITLLASNVLLSLPEEAGEEQAAALLDAEVDELLAAARERGGEWILVSNEVGLGLVPPYPLGRLYRDLLGRANQRLARAADEVLLMVAGIPMQVKGPPRS